jgi:hypothetical protein
MLDSSEKKEKMALSVKKGRIHMTERSKRERAEQEELMARGPVSRDASNKSAPIDQNSGDQQAKGRQTTESTSPDPRHPDYNKMGREHATGTGVGSGSASKRDLGTVGGGTIPPGQPQTSMGDRDASHKDGGKGTNEEIIDPMTSRAPDKLHQQEKAEKNKRDKETTDQKMQS